MYAVVIKEPGCDYEVILNHRKYENAKRAYLKIRKEMERDWRRQMYLQIIQCGPYGGITRVL